MYLCEKLTYSQLLAYSEPKRKERARHVRGPSLKLETGDDSNYYHFNFRSYPSTTGHRHVGFVRFEKPPSDDTPLKNINCEVDCDCPDYKYRFGWSNKQRGAGQVGPSSYNKAHNRAPKITNPTNQPGLCKHLIAVRDYLDGLQYKMPETLKAPERLGRLVTLTNKSVINPDEAGGEAKPVIADLAPFRGSPNQQQAPKFPSRGRVAPLVSPLAAAKRAERERELSVQRQRRGGPNPSEMPPELPDPKMIGARVPRGNTVRPGPIRPGMLQNAVTPPDLPNPDVIGAHRPRGNAVRPGHIRQKNLGQGLESLQSVVKHMNKLYEEAVKDLDGEAALRAEDPPAAAAAGPEGPPPTPEPDPAAGGGEVVELLGEIKDLLQQAFGDGGGAGGDPKKTGFELPDNAEEVDLTTGEAEDEPGKVDELPLAGGDIDIEAQDSEGVEGDDDDEDTVS